MTKTFKPAAHIIKKFGGIRPMARKTNIAVTTVQGWKNRNTIPDDRMEEVLEAARQNGIDPNSLLMESSAPKPQAEKHIPLVDIDDPLEGDRAWQMTENIHQQNIRTTVIGGLSVVLALIALVIAFFAFDKRNSEAPDYDYTLAEFEQRLIAQQSETEKRIEALQQKLQEQQMTAQNTQGTVEEIAQVQSELENLKQALNKEGAGEASGIAQLQATVEGLKTNVDSLRNKLVQIQDYAAQTGISGTDVKATSMLVVLSQLRNAFNRQQPFEEDLALLQKIFNTENDPELATALGRLAPHADKGVISAQGLKSELGGLTNDVITASLMDEDVSIQDKAMARFNKIVQITKDGVPVTGTQTDQTISQAQNYLDQNDVGSAVEVLQQLNPQALGVLGPWMQKAQGNLAAGNVEDIISRRIVGMVRQFTPNQKGSIVQYGAQPMQNLTAPAPTQSQMPPAPLMDLHPNNTTQPTQP